MTSLPLCSPISPCRAEWNAAPLPALIISGFLLIALESPESKEIAQAFASGLPRRLSSCVSDVRSMHTSCLTAFPRAKQAEAHSRACLGCKWGLACLDTHSRVSASLANILKQDTSPVSCTGEMSEGFRGRASLVDTSRGMTVLLRMKSEGQDTWCLKVATDMVHLAL